MGFHLGIDIGVSSVGWAVVNDDYKVIESGSNIFETKKNISNKDRREARQIKRGVRRRKNRLDDYKKLWTKYVGNIPTEKCNIQVELRVKGLSEKLTDTEIYYVLYNMLKHRGISYLEDSVDEKSKDNNDYQMCLEQNRKELESALPCEIQLNRLNRYGQYRGVFEVNDERDKFFLSNVFTIGSYRRELEAFFEEQKKHNNFLTTEFIEEYMSIFNRKRKYYRGPGSKLSRTNYGIYTTIRDKETGQYITEPNIFDKLIGKCSIYPDERRGAAASYTAQEFNALNDLNNLTVNHRKLTEEEKVQIIKIYKNSKIVNVRKIIKKVIKEDIEALSGARIDKKEKELFHTFETYRKMKSAMDNMELDIENYSREFLDEIGEILTLSTDRDGFEETLIDKHICLTDKEIDFFISFRKNNSKLFSKWQSFSIKIMTELIPEMYEQPKEQMTLLTERGVFKKNLEKYVGQKKIPSKEVYDKIYNPVVKRSVNISIGIINAIIKKYGFPEDIIIEVPRDKNSDEQKKRIKEFQSKREKEVEDIAKNIKEKYGIKITSDYYRKNSQLNLKLKLWNEQEGRCLYSGKPIDISELLNNECNVHIDHIIPRSISFDDSRENKALVYFDENESKGIKTPYYYLRNNGKEWDYIKFKSYVLNLSSNGNISKKKKENLLNEDDIFKMDVLRGFLNRNLNDTGYAARTVLNTLQNYFDANKTGTKVKVIRGGFTAQLRKNIRLKKNRDESYSHHAVDAMLICFAHMRYEDYRNAQEDCFDFETGEIIDDTKFKNVFSNTGYENEMYTFKWYDLGESIKEAEPNIKYWHKRDSKYNRQLSNQTIRGTRTYYNDLYLINKLDIRNDKDYKRFLNMIKGGRADDFLMKIHDPKTFEILLQIVEEYRDADNPFVEFERDTGDIIRKYSKKGNGPKVGVLKYKDRKVGSCIDISHKYGHAKNSRKVLLEGINPYRMDVYYNNENNQYYMVGIKYNHCKYESGKYIIDEVAYNNILRDEGLIGDEETLYNLKDKGIEFKLTFYNSEIIKYEKDGELFVERFVSRTKSNRNTIETKPINKPKWESSDGRKQVSLSKTKLIHKIRLDILGNQYECDKEKFSLVLDE